MRLSHEFKDGVVMTVFVINVMIGVGVGLRAFFLFVLEHF